MTFEALFFGGLLAIGGVYLVADAYKARAVAGRLRSAGVSTTGRVVETKKRSFWRDEEAKVCIEFTASSGEVVRFWQEVFFWQIWQTGDQPLGSEVRVIYNPLNPREHRCGPVRLGDTVCESVIGVAMLAFGFWIWWTGEVPEWFLKMS